MPASDLVIPVRVKGLKRSWNFHGVGVGLSCTFLGVDREQNATINGVLVPLIPTDLPGLDRREAGYTRTLVSPSNVEFLDGLTRETTQIDKIMVYETTTPNFPSVGYPIIQSYIDICLEGCLEIDDMLNSGLQFTKEFLSTTFGWSSSWVNDRLFPRAPFRYVPNAGLIDQLLHEYFPTEFRNIRIE